MIRRHLFETLFNDPEEVHAFVVGLAAAQYGRRGAVLALALGDTDPESPAGSDVHEQGWYALAGLLIGDTVIDDL